MGTAWQTAWITGASSGIGRAIAISLARQGVRVAASARSADKLAELAREHSGITPLPLDVTDVAATVDAGRRIEATLGPIDLAIFSAGVWEHVSVSRFSAATCARAMAVNYQGVANGIEAVLPAMLARGAGHMALVASVAGYRGLSPVTAAYGPTKAAVINLAESLRNDLTSRGITISVVNPGYVETPMTSINKFPMPFILSADDAAARIIRGLAARKFEVAFPPLLVGALKLGQMMPNWLYFLYARTFLAPPSRKG